jgi:acetyl esterase/lipase
MSGRGAGQVTFEVNGPPSLSEDGLHAGWLASGDEGTALVLVDVASRRELDRRRVEAVRCRAFTWTRMPGIGLAVSDRTGDESHVLHAVDVRSAEWTAIGGSTSGMRVAGLSGRRPEDVLVASGNGEYRVVSLRTGEASPVAGRCECAAVYFDELFRPRLFETVNADGSRDLRHGEPRGELFLSVPHAEALSTRFLRFSPDGRTAFLELPAGTDATSLVAVQCQDGAPASDPQVLLSAERAGIADVLFSADRGWPDLVQLERGRTHCVALSDDIREPVRALRRLLRAEPVVLERRADDRIWLVTTSSPLAPPAYFVFEPAAERLSRLSAARPRQRRLSALARNVRVPLRDGGRAPAYVVPARPGDRPPPAALLVHGGPWRRSRWAYDERRAWLAAQGLTVIEPNFRGSTGFGSAWIGAGDHEWGGAMQDDLVDALEWAVARGLADPDRLAFVGGSYGGYAVLQLAATGPRPPGCVVALSPLTDLVRFVEHPPAAWRTAQPMLLRRVGDPAVAEERRRLEAVSPVNRAADVDAPVLLVHGANDSRVPPEMSTRMLMALARAGKDGTLAVFPDEGHEIVQAASRRALWGLLGRFLACHLGMPAAAPAPPDARAAMKLFTTPLATPLEEAAPLEPAAVE